MGLLQKAVETYDCNEKYVGMYREGHTVLAPVCHVVTHADLEITLFADGRISSAVAVNKDAPKIVIPVTENSAGRTSGACAHPLCDNLGYLAGYDEKKHSLYVEQLAGWARSAYGHPKLNAVLAYVQNGTILKDLCDRGLIRQKENGQPEKDKMLVCWRVLGAGEPEECYKDESLFCSFINYYQSLHSQEKRDLCMVSGEEARIADQHPKGIIAKNGNSKLISDNDTSGFTYRGRFTESRQAASVGYISSQKAHNALRWLASEQGVREIFGERTFICWNPQGKKVCGATGPFRKSKEIITEPTNYQAELKKTLTGYKNELPDTAGVVIAAFDAATSGRLALTYYNELVGSDFLQRLCDWDSHCCWEFYQYGIQSPSLWQIVNCAFGTVQGKNGKDTLVTDDRVLGQQIQRLVSCRIDKAVMPFDIVKAITSRASTPLAYDEKSIRRTILTTACAVIRKYRYDKFKEEWEMALEPEKADRSYQFGRLLAVLEKAERDTFGSEESREPNAIRQQSIFCQRPLTAAHNIEDQLERAYFPRLKPKSRVFYKNLIGEIMEQISRFPESQWNKPLKETYLMGYYLQRATLYTKKNNDTEEKENGEIGE